MGTAVDSRKRDRVLSLSATAGFNVAYTETTPSSSLMCKQENALL